MSSPDDGDLEQVAQSGSMRGDQRRKISKMRRLSRWYFFMSPGMNTAWGQRSRACADGIAEWMP